MMGTSHRYFRLIGKTLQLRFGYLMNVMASTFCVRVVFQLPINEKQFRFIFKSIITTRNEVGAR